MKLFINEFIKDYRKLTTYIYLLLTIVISLTPAIITKYTKSEEFNAVLNIIDTVSGILIISLIFILIMFANNLSQEYSKGTIKFLYSKAASRSSILTAKIVVAVFNYIFFVVVSAVVVFLVQKYLLFKGKISFSVLKEKMPDGHFGRTLQKQLVMTSLSTFIIALFFIALVLLICVWFKTQILSVVLVMIIIFGEGIIRYFTLALVGKFEIIKYNLFSVPLLSSYYETESGRQLVTEAFKLSEAKLWIIFGVYTFVCVLVAYIINARRDITLD